LEVPDLTDKDVENLKAMEGKETEPYQVEIEKGMIRRLAEAIGDPNPLWQDEEEARKSRYGGIVAPPALYIAYWMDPIAQEKISMPFHGRGLDAQGHWKFYKPVRPGDVITVTSKVVEVYEKQGKTAGRMIFPVFETTLTNQHGEVVCVVRCSRVSF